MLRALDVDLERWDPWTPAQVAHRLRGVTEPWYVLAGCALDLFLGRQTREHDDIEIGVPYDRFPAIEAALGDLELVAVGDGKAWPLTAEALRSHFQTWVREGDGPWRLDVIREHWDGDEWVFRRDARVRVPGTGAIARTQDGIPFLRPEIVLLFKAKATRTKDLHDFETVLPELEPGARDWLAHALRIAHPGHLWLDDLDSR